MVASARVGLDRLDRAGLLEPGQRRVQRPERDARARADQLGELLLQLVAVQVLLVEEAEDGEVDHDVSTQYNGSIYRIATIALATTASNSRGERRTAISAACAPRPARDHSGHARRVASLWPMSFRPGAIRGAVSGTPGEIDYRLARRSLISEFKKGRLAQHEVCDAHPELRRAAQECSEATSMVCPICEDDHVVLVSYVFGPRLPAHGRCITSKAELRKLAKRSGEFACYVVEVCPSCSWNHLARTFLLNPARSA